jgi:hypothetical protein
MLLEVKRDSFDAICSEGELWIDGEFFCYTLEPPWKTDGSKPRAIPDGTYNLVNRFSPKHGRNVPHVDNVPGFNEIEIHWGNFPQDTEGCLLVGASEGHDMIGTSRKVFDELYAKLEVEWLASNTITITYTGQPSDS